jgi:hypothetical protein
MQPTYRLVDEQWTPLGEFAAETTDWSVGQEFFLGDGRGFAIVAMVPSVDGADGFTATWTVESI